jgi:hypothetical protein
VILQRADSAAACENDRPNKGTTVEPVITHTISWTSKSMGYHRLWVFKDSSKKPLKLQFYPKYVSKLPLNDQLK